jgi:hypothetical protein
VTAIRAAPAAASTSNPAAPAAQPGVVNHPKPPRAPVREGHDQQEDELLGRLVGICAGGGSRTAAGTRAAR